MSTAILHQNGDSRHLNKRTRDTRQRAASHHTYDLLAPQLIALADQLPGTIRATVDFVDRLDQAATRLEGHTCTGQPHWRDKDKPNKQPKLYIIHPINTFCPLHGMPEPQQRIRTYIGSDTRKHAPALAAIADETRRRQLVAQRDALSQELYTALASLQHLLQTLGYDPATGEAHSSIRSFTVDELLAL